MKEYDIVVLIGRFQPIHNGHLPAFQKATDLAPKVVCVIGSANKPSVPKNPFSNEERKNMILDTLTNNKGTEFISDKLSFVSVEDTFYLKQEWFRRVKKEVSQFEEEVLEKKKKLYNNIIGSLTSDLTDAGLDVNNLHELKMHLSLNGHYTEISQKIKAYQSAVKESETCNIAVLGHLKDPSSEYLNGFASWDKIDIGPWVGDFEHDKPISATDIRDLWFSGKLSFARSNISTPVYNTMLNWPEVDFLDLQEDWNIVNKYKIDNQKTEHEVQFLTTDAVVIHGDEILLVKRGNFPGRGLWSLPGTFKYNNETFFDGCIRGLLEKTRIKLQERVLRGSFKEEKMFDYPDRSPRGTIVSMVYSFVLDPSQTRPIVHAQNNAIEAWWFPLAEILKMRDKMFEDHLDMIEFMTSRI